jgi:hypothetical protein
MAKAHKGSTIGTIAVPRGNKYRGRYVVSNNELRKRLQAMAANIRKIYQEKSRAT